MLQRVGAEEAAGQSLTASQAREVAAEVQRRLRLRVQKLSLSRGGLARAVGALGDPRLLSEGTPKQRAAAIADVLFHHRTEFEALVAAAASRARASHDAVAAAVPEIFVAQFVRLSERAQAGLDELYCRMPSLLHLEQGSPHADIADIVQRRCGAGPYGRVVLRRRLRQVLAEASGYQWRGVTAWYIGRMLRPAQVAARHVQKAMRL